MVTIPESPVVHRPVMYQSWLDLTFLHWRYPADVVQRLLPPGLTVQEFDGSAWIGLVPFTMSGVRFPGVPALPWMSRFPETNVRTYVTGPDGSQGIWFFSLDATRLPAVLVGRTTYRLPYVWSRMRVQATPGRFRYTSARRWPGPRGARCDAVVARGPAIEPGALEYFLTYRFQLYSVIRGRLVQALAAHGPWPLFGGTLESLSENVIAAGGLPAPEGEPLVHTSPGVAVRIGGWRRVTGR
ncbi:YqjF family protein [Virgisporangium ochraceum]|uniref:DUF2071 domain-containing protein n=1 Tax=Virgisporangium ochraceum TaxID=65505 RepID=A0A8J3ZTX1_9ACTN|nr:DUF2071 domain-containing protein [Virgisporangium ochraceum]GIJ69824.1 hypothetical protein Voc01_047410 [Virgisporangium ochraceum]